MIPTFNQVRTGQSRQKWKAVTILCISISAINLDSSHVIAKKGGKAVAYRGRKKAKTTNILPMTDATAFIVASTGLLVGNHNDTYQLKPHLQKAFMSLKHFGFEKSGAYFNADKAIDNKAARKTRFNHGLLPNIDENQRNCQSAERGKNVFSTKRFISTALPASVPLPGSINSDLCYYGSIDANLTFLGCASLLLQ